MKHSPNTRALQCATIHLAAQYFLIPALRCGLNALGLLTQGWSNALAPHISRQRFVMDTLPESFCGLKILQLSDLHVDGIYPAMEKMLEGLHPRLGTFGILGNHDASEEVAELEQLGIRM